MRFSSFSVSFVITLGAVGECLSGALQWKELVQLALDIGFAPPILVESFTFTSNKDAVSELLGTCTHACIAIGS